MKKSAFVLMIFIILMIGITVLFSTKKVESDQEETKVEKPIKGVKQHPNRIIEKENPHLLELSSTVTKENNTAILNPDRIIEKENPPLLKLSSTVSKENNTTILIEQYDNSGRFIMILETIKLFPIKPKDDVFIEVLLNKSYVMKTTFNILFNDYADDLTLKIVDTKTNQVTTFDFSVITIHLEALALYTMHIDLDLETVYFEYLDDRSKLIGFNHSEIERMVLEDPSQIFMPK